jgi:hypothetical protein
MRLKLETVQKDHLSIHFKERTRLWTFDFSITLAIALAIHLLAIFFINIDLGSPPKLASSPRVRVQTTGAFLETSLLSEKETSPYKLPPLPRSKASLSVFLAKNPIPSKNASLRDSFSLDVLEDRFEAAMAPRVLFSRGYSIQSASALPIKRPDARPGCALLRFQAGKSGSIIWLEWIQSTGDTSQDQAIEQYLKQIRLNIPSENRIVKGEVEIHL